jgi:hypothetical protein
MDIATMRRHLEDIAFENYAFLIFRHEERYLYLQATYIDADVTTKQPTMQHTRKWLLSEHMTKSELVQTAFKCALTSMEHRAREAFRYRGKRVFGPHFDVDALHGICKDEHLDYRRTDANIAA